MSSQVAGARLNTGQAKRVAIGGWRLVYSTGFKATHVRYRACHIAVSCLINKLLLQSKLPALAPNNAAFIPQFAKSKTGPPLPAMIALIARVVV